MSSEPIITIDIASTGPFSNILNIEDINRFLIYYNREVFDLINKFGKVIFYDPKDTAISFILNENCDLNEIINLYNLIKKELSSIIKKLNKVDSNKIFLIAGLDINENDIKNIDEYKYSSDNHFLCNMIKSRMLNVKMVLLRKVAYCNCSLSDIPLFSASEVCKTSNPFVLKA